MKRNLFLISGILGSLLLSTGCNSNNSNTKTPEIEQQKINVEEQSDTNEGLFVNKIENDTAPIIRYQTNNKDTLTRPNWTKVELLYSLNRNDVKKDLFKMDSNLSPDNEVNPIEYSFDLERNSDVGVFLGQEKGKDEWVIKIGMNDIDRGILEKYLKPLTTSLYANILDKDSVTKFNELSDEIIHKIIEELAKLNEDYNLCILELDASTSIILNKKDTINTLTKFDLPNIYTYNIEIKYY